MAEAKKEYNSILIGKCQEPKLNEDGTPWLIPFGIPEEQVVEIQQLVNERKWLNGALRLTRAGSWVIQVNKPDMDDKTSQEKSLKNEAVEADGLPF
jgi:hypothetical protein